ncbi:hypothetical protein VTL71DRAFT_9927 [Oculimacula yallundae]|uniref:Uncharacterized protein n=1 Tax=Oculimacula yallundae TaxID=86028 RepID=A0ABR4BR29_9HELO
MNFITHSSVTTFYDSRIDDEGVNHVDFRALVLAVGTFRCMGGVWNQFWCLLSCFFHSSLRLARGDL